jgi:hypothetical protein
LLYLVTYPVFYAISVTAIKEFLKRHNIKIGTGIFLFIFITNGDWGNLLNDIFNINVLPDVSNVNKVGTKLSIYPVIIIGVINFINHLRQSSLISIISVINGLFLVLICTLYPTSIPVVLFLIVFIYGYFIFGKHYWKIVTLVLFVILAILAYKSKSFMYIVYLTYPIQHLVSYFPLIFILVFTSYKLEFIKLNYTNKISNLILLSIGIWIFLVLLRLLGILNLYNNPDSAQIYANFTYEFVLVVILLVICAAIIKISEIKNSYKFIIFFVLLLGFVLNQKKVFLFYHPMNSKILKLSNSVINENVLIWDRDTNDFNTNTSNWLIHFTIPYSNTRWNNSNYFPILRTLPQENQIKTVTQRYVYEGVVKKASNYKNNYFNDENSVFIEHLMKSETKKN